MPRRCYSPYISVIVRRKEAGLVRGQPVDPPPQALLVDGSDLIPRPISASLPAQRICSRPRQRGCSLEVSGQTTTVPTSLFISLRLTITTGTNLVDLTTDRGVEISKVDGIPLGEVRHQSNPSAAVTSKSLQSSCSEAIAR